MISIVVVYNNGQILNDILVKNLKNQTAEYELIAVDNTKGTFISAAHALNFGGNKAIGKYIMFIHQDVALDSSIWLETVENKLNDLQSLGIAGVVGMSTRGRNYNERWRGYIDNNGEIWPWCKPLQMSEEVQTLDECLLIIPSLTFRKMQFDEKTFDGWHCYGADYCLSVIYIGLKAYVLPVFIRHMSPSSNVQNLFKYQMRLFLKHKKNYPIVFTTCGEISWIKLPFLFIKSKLIEINVFRPIYNILKKYRV
ncbi:MAG: glycosyltransferase [Candidatus Methanoperedens sp.]|nr:glycosyltransferase [Candidatus Methanoperedens sp.]